MKKCKTADGAFHSTTHNSVITLRRGQMQKASLDRALQISLSLESNIPVSEMLPFSHFPGNVWGLGV